MSRGYSKAPLPLPLSFAPAEAANATALTIGTLEAATTAMVGVRSSLGVKQTTAAAGANIARI